MSARVATWLAWSLCALCGALAAACLIFSLLNGHTLYEMVLTGIPTTVILLTQMVSFSVVGALIASHRPENPIGWLFCAAALFYGIEIAGEEYAIYALFTNPDSLPLGAELAWLTEWIWVPAFGIILVFLPLLFPDGHLPSRRWRGVGWLGGLSIGLICVLTSIVLWPERGPALLQLEGFGGEVEEWRSAISEWVLQLGGPMLLVAGLGAVISLFVRFRRARGDERQQIKWFASAAALTLAWILVAEVIVAEQQPGEIVALSGLLVIASIPVATGIAILRYRLYDIDRIINRTLVYGSLTVMLALLYFGGVSAIQALFGALTGQEEQPQLAIVVSTLVIAALFNPLRRRIQSFIDRSFYRSKYDAAKTLEAFSAKLRDETDLDALSDDLTRVVSETMQPAHVSVWLHSDPALKDKKKRAAIRESGHDK
jgi:heme/copper-type cytochrome/quinol oxidase subunit 2